MALPDPALPYGLRDIRLWPLSGVSNETIGTAVDLPVARTLSFSEAEDFEELRGDDKIWATRGKGAQVEWDLEAGGISLDAWKVMVGGTIATSGTTPSQVKTLSKSATGGRPYFRMEGQMINDNSGDTHCVLFKNKITGNVEGEFGDGVFFVTKASGVTLPLLNDDLYDITWNETATAIDDTPT